MSETPITPAPLSAPPPLPARSAIPHCPDCDYSFEGLPPNKCPECGYEPEDDELADNSRRRMFAELTLISQFSWLATLMAVAAVTVLTVGIDLNSPGLLLFIIAPFFVVLGLGAQFGVASRSPRAYRSLIRRLWRMTLVWMQLPWVLAMVGEVVAQASKNRWPQHFVQDTSLGFNSTKLTSGEAILSMTLSGSVGTAVAYFLWRWRWKKLLRVSGLPLRTTQQVGRTIPLAIALFPGTLVFVLPCAHPVADTEMVGVARSSNGMNGHVRVREDRVASRDPPEPHLLAGRCAAAVAPNRHAAVSSERDPAQKKDAAEWWARRHDGNGLKIGGWWWWWTRRRWEPWLS